MRKLKLDLLALGVVESFIPSDRDESLGTVHGHTGNPGVLGTCDAETCGGGGADGSGYQTACTCPGVNTCFNCPSRVPVITCQATCGPQQQTCASCAATCGTGACVCPIPSQLATNCCTYPPCGIE